MNKITLGTPVIWRGGWGKELPKKAKVIGITLCENEGEKYGLDVTEVFVKDKNRCCFDLDNGHWAYGSQIDIPELIKEKFCPDCRKTQVVNIIIPICDKNPEGKTPDYEHGNKIDGVVTCTDEYCNPTEKEWDGITPLSEFSDWYYRCSVCDTLNVNP